MPYDTEEEGRLFLYTASAGAGKTFAITREFLSLSLRAQATGDSAGYSSILAVSFTNKATAEMRTRFLESLFILSSKPDESPYIADFRRDPILKDKNLKALSAKLLQGMLFHYSRLNVKTIDSFFQEVLRNLSLELHMPTNLRTVLTVDYVLMLAVDRVFQMQDSLPAQKGAPKTNWQRETFKFLTDYINETSASGTNAKTLSAVKRSLINLGYELFKEQVRRAIQKKEFPGGVEEVVRLQKAINRRFEELEEVFLPDIRRAQEIDIDLAQAGLKYKKTSPVVSLLKSVQQEYNSPHREYNAAQEGYNAAQGEATRASAPTNGGYGVGHFKEVCEVLEERLSKTRSVEVNLKGTSAQEQEQAGLAAAFYSSAMNFYREHRRQILTFNQILRNITPFALLAALSQALTNLKQEEGIIFLDDTKELLAGIISGQSSAVSPFIYERTGSYLSRFMIDEFQDTSAYQYHNFKPLLREALAQGRQSFVVGDAKQSIYRFRNSDPSIIQSGIRADFGRGAYPQAGESGYLSPVLLNENWRSAPAVVAFNNFIFSELPAKIDTRLGLDGVCRAVYTDHFQHVPPAHARQGGRVEIIPYGDPERKERAFPEVCSHIPLLIEQLRARGYRLSDIAVLSVTNRQLSDIAKALIAHNSARQENAREGEPLRFVSEEHLNLQENELFRLCLTLLKVLALIPAREIYNLASPKEEASRGAESEPDTTPHREASATKQRAYEYDRSLYQAYYKMGEAQFALLKRDRAGASIPDYALIVGELGQYIAQQTLYDLTQRLITALSPLAIPEDTPYLLALSDLVHDYEKENIADVGRFTEWIETEAGKLLLPMTAADSVSLMTIHKAKGLGFPVIILADYLSLKRPNYNDRIWCTLPPDDPALKGIPPEDIPRYPLPISLGKTIEQGAFAGEYQAELGRAITDRLNAFYVACTRAKNELYIYAPRSKTALSDSVVHEDFTALLREAVSGAVPHTKCSDAADENVRQVAFTAPVTEPLTADASGEYAPLEDTPIRFVYQGAPDDAAPALQARKEEPTDPSLFRSFTPNFASRPYPVRLHIKKHFESQSTRRGTTLHRILSQMKAPSDLPRILEQEVLCGELSRTQAREWSRSLNALLSLPQVRAVLENNRYPDRLTEQTILFAGHKELSKRRPDLILYNPTDKTAEIVDYKTGQPHPGYAAQLRRYATLLEEAGIRVRRAWLLYVDIPQDPLAEVALP